MPPNNGTAAQDHAEDVDDNNPHRDLVAAEHLECNDDLCSSILVDQIGCERLKEGRLGVHHQQAKFVGPSIVSSEVLSIIRKVSRVSSLWAVIVGH
jgi:histone-lysine N-methyltransferase SUV420H